MLHKVGKKWKLGNIEQSSKEDLRTTAYRIWAKGSSKGSSKGSFSKFWKTGKVDEAELGKLQAKLVFKKVPHDELVDLLDEIEAYNESKRFDPTPCLKSKDLLTD